MEDRTMLMQMVGCCADHLVDYFWLAASTILIFSGLPEYLKLECCMCWQLRVFEA